jgi:hypothetical protein
VVELLDVQAAVLAADPAFYNEPEPPLGGTPSGVPSQATPSEAMPFEEVPV